MTTQGKFLFGGTVGAWLNIWAPLFGSNAAFVLPILFGAWAFYELLRYRATLSSDKGEEGEVSRG